MCILRCKYVSEMPFIFLNYDKEITKNQDKMKKINLVFEMLNKYNSEI